MVTPSCRDARHPLLAGFIPRPDLGVRVRRDRGSVESRVALLFIRGLEGPVIIAGRSDLGTCRNLGHEEGRKVFPARLGGGAEGGVYRWSSRAMDRKAAGGLPDGSGWVSSGG